MATQLATLDDVVTVATTFETGKPLIFTTDEGDIGPGYHVTELKHLSVNSIDCGGRMSAWTEAQLQLLDGNAGGHMSVGKFIGIAKHSAAALPELGKVPISVEFAPGNRGLRRYLIDGLHEDPTSVRVKLIEDGAACKPHLDKQSGCYSEKAVCC